MQTPSLRGVTVAAGIVGIALMVVGAATAVAQAPADQAVATAVQLEVDTEASLAPVTADAPAAHPVEVGRGPIECSETGSCGDDAPDLQTIAVTVETPEPEPEPEPAAASAPPATCALPDAPAKPSDGDTDAWVKLLHAWIRDSQPIAEACDLTWDAWRAASEDVWPDGWDEADAKRWWSEAIGAWNAMQDDPKASSGDDGDGATEAGKGDGDGTWGDRRVRPGGGASWGGKDD
ncbi:hypothetical protein [uncultured Demequina sp.]|uniref:hypothetical protein n=1 Tax=uncultured Demequina sp. TaxID=693499 RepID=UPI0025EFC2E4|nr:hypothetical protein [uncultured Demequina sp.]